MENKLEEQEMLDIDYLGEALERITEKLEEANSYLAEAVKRKESSGVWTLEDERRLGESLGLSSASLIVRTLLEEKRRKAWAKC